jgi:hypothetical protein
MLRLAPLVLVVAAAGCGSAASKIVVFPQPGKHGACRAKQLGVFADTEGGGGAMVGGFQLRNRGSEVCSLRGRPDLAMLDQAGKPLPVRVLPTRDVAVRLRPQAAAEVRFQWRNWCRLNFPATVTMRLRLPNGGGTVTVRTQPGRPRCDAPSEPSTLAIGPFASGAK